MATALVSTGQAAQPYGAAVGPRAVWHTADDDARLLRYRLFLNFEAGKHDVGRLPVGQNPVSANYARVFVRKAASYLFPEPTVINVKPPDASDLAQALAQQIDSLLTTIRRHNDLDAMDIATAVDSAVLGDGCYKVTWDQVGRLPRITPVDPQRLYVQTAPDDHRRVAVVRHVVEMHHTDVLNQYGLTRFDIPDADKLQVVEAWSDQYYWVEVQGLVVKRTINPYGFLPYLVFPNMSRPHEFWGLSDVADIIDVNRALDRRLSLLAALLEVSGNPVTVLENITGAQGINVAPGAVWELPADAKAYLLELLGQGTVAQHLSFIEGLYRIMDDLGEMPRMSWGDSGAARSGVALAIQLQPVVQKISRRRMTWTGVIERRARYALLLMQRFGGLDLAGYQLDDFGLEAVWAPILPSDRQALVADEIALYEAGLHSQQTAIRAIGIDDAAAEAQQIAADAPPPIRAMIGTTAGVEGVSPGDEPSASG